MAANQPDFSFSIDALFAHMVNNLGHKMDEPREWVFSMRGEDLDELSELADQLEDEFDVHLQPQVEEIDAAGKSTMGPPCLSVIVVDALEPGTVKELSAKFQSLAAERGLKYEGVNAYEPFDGDEFPGWMTREETTAKIPSLKEELDEGCGLAFVFAIAAETKAVVNAAAKMLRTEGIEDCEAVEEDGEHGLVVRVEGEPSGVSLASAFDKLDRVAAGAGGELLGVQFEVDGGCDCCED
ncbi:MAG: ribonuclease E inhibitor RraB [Phycisphaerales bacterium]